MEENARNTEGQHVTVSDVEGTDGSGAAYAKHSGWLFDEAEDASGCPKIHVAFRVGRCLGRLLFRAASLDDQIAMARRCSSAPQFHRSLGLSVVAWFHGAGRRCHLGSLRSMTSQSRCLIVDVVVAVAAALLWPDATRSTSGCQNMVKTCESTDLIRDA